MAINSNFRTLTADNIEGVVAPRNYLKNSFENGTIAGWTEMAVTLTSGLPTGTPTISSTAASSIALTNTTTTPLSLSRSLLVTGAAGWTAGQGFISDEFTLDRMDLGKPLTVTFDYERVTGTLNFSGTLGSQTLMVYIYDATAGGANWIQPAGFLGMNQSSGPGRVSCTFQSSVVAGQKYRVAVIASQAVGSACSLEFDNFTCSRVTAPIGPVVTDWRDFPSVAAGTLITSTGTTPSFGTTSVNRARWRRVGDSAEIEWNFAQTSAGTAGTGAYLFNLPAGLILDSGYTFNTNVSSASTSISAPNVVGSFDANYEAGASKSIGTGEVIPYSATQLKVYVGFTTESAATDSEWWGPFYGFNLSPMSMTIRASVKIQGWSSSVQMSNDTDTRVVGFNGSIGAVAYTANTTNITATAVRDTHAAWNGSQYVAPVSGDYIAMFTTIANTTNGFGYMFVNGVAVSGYGSYQATANQAGSGTQYLPNIKAGDLISLRIGGSNGTTVSGGAISIFRISGPSVVAASETVAARAETSIAQILNTTPTILNFAVVNYDTHKAITTGASWKFTAPVSGKYRINMRVSSNFLTTALSIYFDVYKNGVNQYQVAAGVRETATSSQIFAPGSTTIELNAGDYISIYGYTSTSTNNWGANGWANYINIERIGN